MDLFLALLLICCVSRVSVGGQVCLSGKVAEGFLMRVKAHPWVAMCRVNADLTNIFKSVK